MKIRSALSKKDVFVLVGCLFFMLAALGSTGRMGREDAKRAVCAGNEGQILRGLLNYANENEGEIPLGFGYWPWDAGYDEVNEIMESMGIDTSHFQLEEGEYDPIAPQDVFYCPTNYTQAKGRDKYWSYNIYLSGGQPAGYRILGYVFLWAANWNNNGTRPILGLDGNPDPTKKWVKTIFVENPSETELVVDALLSVRDNFFTGDTYDLNEFPNGNFGQITYGGMPPMYGYFDGSSHLKSLKEPYGGNIGFVDGHVEWRDFKDMANRITTSSGGPLWWW
jgi:prepilin-type processing-associated H-X9-DG protein